MAMNPVEVDRGLAPAQAVAHRAQPGHGQLRVGAAAASGAGHHRDVRRRRADAARQLGASRREGRAEGPRHLRRRRVDHHLLLHRPVRGRPRRRVGGVLQAARQRAGRGDRRRHGACRLRHPVGVGVPVGDRRQHPVRRHHDPADQGHGAGLRRARAHHAAVVVPVARRLPGRQRHA